MKHHSQTVRLMAGRLLALACLLGAPYVIYAQGISWNFEGGNTHGFTFRSANPATPATTDPTTAGDESLTGVGGAAGLPTNGLAWVVGAPNDFNGLKPAFVEGSHINTNGVLDYTLGGQPIPPAPNARGQTNYLNTYSLNQWGDNLNTTNNDQIAKSPNVLLQANAVLLVWSYGGGSGATVHAPVLDPTPALEYTDGSSGIAVRSAADNSLLASLRTDGAGTLKGQALNLSTFAGQTVYVEVVDAFQGSFGWLAVDEIQITNLPITLAADDFTFEAEDFNFTSGLFIDNPNLILNDANCYYKKGSGTGLEGVDFHEVNPTAHFGIDTVEWRFDGFNAFANLPQTTNSFDMVRSQYTTAGVADYDLATNSIGDWCNYTRTFPATNAHLYARVASAGAFRIQVDLVSNPTVSNQTLVTRGWFIGNSGTSGLYQMVPLTDLSGSNLVVVTFDGTPKTLRMTSLTAGYAANFYVLDPTNAVENLLPIVSITSPTNDQVLTIGVTTSINVTATDDGSVTNVQFYAGGVLVGEDNTSPFSVTFTPSGAESPLILRAVATDNTGLTTAAEITVKRFDPTFIKLKNTVGNGADNDLNEALPANNAGAATELQFRWGANHRIWVGRFDVSGYDLSKATDASLNCWMGRDQVKFITLRGILPSATNANANWNINTYTELGLTYSNMPGMNVQDGVLSTPDWDTNHTVIIGTNLMFGLPSSPLDSFTTNVTQYLRSQAGQTNIVIAIEYTVNTEGNLGRIMSKEANSVRQSVPFLTGNVGDFAPYLRFKSELAITAANLSGDQLTLQWSGGTGPYKIQKKTLLTDAWVDHITGIAGTNTTVTISGDTGFYRVGGQ